MSTQSSTERQIELPLDCAPEPPTKARVELPEAGECEHRWERGPVLFTLDERDLVEYYCVDCWRTEYVVRGGDRQGRTRQVGEARPSG